MSISTEIIDVLDNLCQKFGIIVDWTNDNVFPYIEQICQKVVKYELYTSIAWIIICSIIAIALTIVCIKFVKVGNNLSKSAEWIDRTNAGDYYILTGLIIVFIIVAIIVIIVQTFDIVTCNVFPEKVIFDYIRNYMPR